MTLSWFPTEEMIYTQESTSHSNRWGNHTRIRCGSELENLWVLSKCPESPTKTETMLSRTKDAGL